MAKFKKTKLLQEHSVKSLSFPADKELLNSNWGKILIDGIIDNIEALVSVLLDVIMFT